ncbi:PQQ-binding-like beta-propeller repeat protein [Streptomyces sp. NPDC056600]|uniref:outer membrane protein assembly factor BamB family protein n=1 Tax=Streptomyces sp. NPDC056600 TaxID=3345874 RepID=UPI003691F144
MNEHPSGRPTAPGPDAPAPSRRRLLRLAGGALALAATGAAVTGCDGDAGGGTSGGGSAKPSVSAGKGGNKGKAGNRGDGAPEPRWQAQTTAEAMGVVQALVVADGVVIATGDPLKGYDAATGKERWSREELTVPGAQMLLGDGTLYLASGQYDGDVVGIDPATGEETWRSRLGGAYGDPRVVAVDDTQVYVIAAEVEDGELTRRNVIAAIDTASGRPVWKERRDAGTEEHGIIAAVLGRHLIYTDYRKNLTVRDTATGRQVWTHKVGEYNYQRFGVAAGLVMLADGGKLRAFDVESGKQRWALAAEEFTKFVGPTVLEGVLYVSDTNRKLFALDPASGDVMWENTGLSDREATSPWHFALSGDVLYAATELDPRGGVYALDARTGDYRWTYNDGSGELDEWFVTTAGGSVFCLHGKRLTALPA